VGKKSVPSACPTWQAPTVFHANHGQSKLLLNGSVLAESCSSQALDATPLRYQLSRKVQVHRQHRGHQLTAGFHLPPPRAEPYIPAEGMPPACP
jgi:hypothetical protein